MTIHVYRGRAVVEWFRVDERTTLNQRLFGENIIVSSTRFVTLKDHRRNKLNQINKIF